jgi:hypothetical protein
MRTLQVLKDGILRCILIIAAAALVGFCLTMAYESFHIFMHTSYWLVVLFLLMILLSNALARLAQMFLDI